MYTGGMLIGTPTHSYKTGSFLFPQMCIINTSVLFLRKYLGTCLEFNFKRSYDTFNLFQKFSERFASKYFSHQLLFNLDSSTEFLPSYLMTNCVIQTNFLPTSGIWCSKIVQSIRSARHKKRWEVVRRGGKWYEEVRSGTKRWEEVRRFCLPSIFLPNEFQTKPKCIFQR